MTTDQFLLPHRPLWTLKVRSNVVHATVTWFPGTALIEAMPTARRERSSRKRPVLGCLGNTGTATLAGVFSTGVPGSPNHRHASSRDKPIR